MCVCVCVWCVCVVCAVCICVYMCFGRGVCVVCPEYPLEALMLKLKLQYFGHQM